VPSEAPGFQSANVREDELIKYEEDHPAIPHYIRYKHVLKLKNGFFGCTSPARQPVDGEGTPYLSSGRHGKREIRMPRP